MLIKLSSIRQILKLNFLKKLLILSGFFLITIPLQTACGQKPDSQPLDNHLVDALNNQNINNLSRLLSQEDIIELDRKYESFKDIFPNAVWTIISGEPLQDGRSSLIIRVKAEETIDVHRYSLESEQRIGFRSEGGRVNDPEIISEYSIIESSDSNLPIEIQIPDAVLTGEKYDVDLIYETPLNEEIIAGGLIAISQKEFENQISPDMELEPLGAGGLFKSVTAPLSPSIQRWSALLVHPKGIFSITKMVRVVSDESEINP